MFSEFYPTSSDSAAKHTRSGTDAKTDDQHGFQSTAHVQPTAGSSNVHTSEPASTFLARGSDYPDRPTSSATANASWGECLKATKVDVKRETVVSGRTKGNTIRLWIFPSTGSCCRRIIVTASVCSRAEVHCAVRRSVLPIRKNHPTISCWPSNVWLCEHSVHPMLSTHLSGPQN